MKANTQYVKVRIGDIPAAKLKKACSGGKISFTKDQVMGDSRSIHLHPVSAKALMSAKKAKKGINLPILWHEIEADFLHHQRKQGKPSKYGAGFIRGGSIWTDIYNWGKKNWDVIKPVLGRVADVALPALSTVLTGNPALGVAGRQLTKELTGVGLTLKQKRIANLVKARAMRKKKSGGSFLPAGY